MTANWPKTSDDNKNQGNVGSVTVEDDDEEEDGDDLQYHFYYKSNSGTKGSNNNLNDNTNFIALKTTDANTLETVLPGIQGVIITST